MCNSSKQYFIQFVYPHYAKSASGGQPKKFFCSLRSQIFCPPTFKSTAHAITQVVCENVDPQSYVLFSIFSNNICCSAFVFT